jgi:hypothetical protein
MKNKAIINEDTTGELKILEQQCKKLKEENVQLKTKLMKSEQNSFYKLNEGKENIKLDNFQIINSIIDHNNIIDE